MGSFISTLVFQPPEITYKRAKKIIWLKSKDGVEIPAIYVDKKSNITILFSHGNAEDLGMIYEWLVTMAYELRVSLCMYSFVTNTDLAVINVIVSLVYAGQYLGI